MSDSILIVSSIYCHYLQCLQLARIIAVFQGKVGQELYTENCKDVNPVNEINVALSHILMYLMGKGEMRKWN